MATLAIVNIGALVTGRLKDAVRIDADTILVRDGRISAIGPRSRLDISAADQVLDAVGTTVAPGLIDSHVHLVLGDWTPRQNATGFIESYMHGGVTRMISASEVHAPGCPRDPVGVKSLAITAQRAFANIRPGGVTVHAGSVIIQAGMTEQDFDELARAGVWLGKVGFGDFRRQSEAEPMVRWAQARGFRVMCHTGGASIPGSAPVTADDLAVLKVDVSGHVNGGTTALSPEDQERVVANMPWMALQICQAGNLKAALNILRIARERDQLHRIIIATDTPTGTGVMPLGMIKSVAELSSLGDVPPEQALAMATGLVAEAWGLKGVGYLEEGMAADFVVMDAPLGGHARNALMAIAMGDIPGISAVFTGGEVRAMRSRNTPPATRMALLVSPNGR